MNNIPVRMAPAPGADPKNMTDMPKGSDAPTPAEQSVEGKPPLDLCGHRLFAASTSTLPPASVSDVDTPSESAPQPSLGEPAAAAAGPVTFSDTPPLTLKVAEEEATAAQDRAPNSNNLHDIQANGCWCRRSLQ